MLTVGMTNMQTGHLTALFSIGSALLYYAVDVLGMEELRPWKYFEKGDSSSIFIK